MADAERDNNGIPTLIAVSSSDGVTPVKLYADPTTHRLLVDLPATGVTILAATGTVDDSNTDFTFASEPTVIVVNGLIYRKDAGWSWSDPTATLASPVGTGGDIYGLN